jgi:hypothetical protein
MTECDFDFDGFAGGPWANFLKWNGVRYPTVEEIRKRAPVYKHAVALDAMGLFGSDLLPPDDAKRKAAPADVRLGAGTFAVDAGQPLPGFNEAFAGRGPDLGAFEVGDALPQYGPRPERTK